MFIYIVCVNNIGTLKATFTFKDNIKLYVSMLDISLNKN